MPKFHITLQSQDNEHRRYVTLSTVPCPSCDGDPVKRGGYYASAQAKTKTPVCSTCGGLGEVEATRESAVAHVERLEDEYAAFRLDDPATIARYDTLDEDSLAIAEQNTIFVPKDTVLIDGRFVRGGKVLTNPDRDPSGPAYSSMQRGWTAFHNQEKPYKVERIGPADEMMVTGGLYGVPIKNLLGGSNLWDWDTDTIKLALTTSSYAQDIDTHDFFNDVTNELTTAGNYTAGGWTLTASAPGYDTATDQIRLDATDVSQASATFTARKAVVYKSTGTASTSPLISFLDFVSDVSPSAGTFSIVFDATGVVVIDVT